MIIRFYLWVPLINKLFFLDDVASIVVKHVRVENSTMRVKVEEFVCNNSCSSPTYLLNELASVVGTLDVMVLSNGSETTVVERSSKGVTTKNDWNKLVRMRQVWEEVQFISCFERKMSSIGLDMIEVVTNGSPKRNKLAITFDV